MLFHSPESWATIRACYKRALRAKPGTYSKAHSLAAAWENTKLVADAEQHTGNGMTPAEYEAMRVAETGFTLRCLDWFAGKVDAYLKTNMFDSDADLQAMLCEWKDRLILDPLKLSHDA